MREAGFEPALPEERRLKRRVLDHSTIRASIITLSSQTCCNVYFRFRFLYILFCFIGFSNNHLPLIQRDVPPPFHIQFVSLNGFRLMCCFIASLLHCFIASLLHSSIYATVAVSVGVARLVHEATQIIT